MTLLSTAFRGQHAPGCHHFSGTVVTTWQSMSLWLCAVTISREARVVGMSQHMWSACRHLSRYRQVVSCVGSSCLSVDTTTISRHAAALLSAHSTSTLSVVSGLIIWGGACSQHLVREVVFYSVHVVFFSSQCWTHLVQRMLNCGKIGQAEAVSLYNQWSVGPWMLV